MEIKKKSYHLLHMRNKQNGAACVHDNKIMNMLALVHCTNCDCRVKRAVVMC
jgi:hypothetical protein